MAPPADGAYDLEDLTDVTDDHAYRRWMVDSQKKNNSLMKRILRALTGGCIGSQDEQTTQGTRRPGKVEQGAQAKNQRALQLKKRDFRGTGEQTATPALKQRNQRKRQNKFDDDEKWIRNGDRPFTKAKRSNRDVSDQNELYTYASLEKMLHKAIHVVRQLKKKGNTNTSSAPKQQSHSSSLSNSDLKTNVLSSDKSKAVKTTSKALSTRCFKCHRIGHYANKCQKQKSLVTLEKIETEPEKEDPLPIFDDYAHEPKEGSGGEQNLGHKEGSSSIHKLDRTQVIRPIVNAYASAMECMEKYKSQWVKLEAKTVEAMAQAYERAGSILKAIEITTSKEEVYRLRNMIVEKGGVMKVMRQVWNSSRKKMNEEEIKMFMKDMGLTLLFPPVVMSVIWLFAATFPHSMIILSFACCCFVLQF
uniref:CCHC-type domain-containing protein n=4 Tax=Brassica TaxID=3705 RepID=A0A0D2ZVD0_BRAOL